MLFIWGHRPQTPNANPDNPVNPVKKNPDNAPKALIDLIIHGG